MSSREMMVLLAGLPELSDFKEAATRTFRVIDRDGKLMLTPAFGRPDPDVTVVEEYVDWPFDRKLMARNVREIALQRADGAGYQPDLSGLQEPLQRILAEQAEIRNIKRLDKARAQIDEGLFGF